MRPFGVRLTDAVATRGPLCVGIDPHDALLAAWGLPDTPAGLETFARTVVDAVGDRVAVLKPQSAFFERHGSAGVAVLERTLAAGRAAGALMLLDAKRGDIGSTVAAYAQAYCDPASSLYADAVTATPYLGYGSLDPLLATAAEHGGGVFVLALTSNPEGASVQRARLDDGRTVAGSILDQVRAANADATARGELGSVGVVVGATLTGVTEQLGCGGPLLAPGLGAQGATPGDLATLFGPALRQVLPAMSREVLRHGPDPQALRDAVDEALAQCRSALAAGGPT